MLFLLQHHSFASQSFCYHVEPFGAYGPNYGWRRYICKKLKKPVICRNKDTVVKDEKCVCKDGYVDIRESDDVDRKKYKQVTDTEECS